MMHTDDNLIHNDVYESMKRLVGARAIQTVKVKNIHITCFDCVK